MSDDDDSFIYHVFLCNLWGEKTSVVKCMLTLLFGYIPRKTLLGIMTLNSKFDNSNLVT